MAHLNYKEIKIYRTVFNYFLRYFNIFVTHTKNPKEHNNISKGREREREIQKKREIETERDNEKEKKDKKENSVR